MFTGARELNVRDYPEITMKDEDKDMHQVNGVMGFTGSIRFKKQKFILTGA